MKPNRSLVFPLIIEMLLVVGMYIILFSELYVPLVAVDSRLIFFRITLVERSRTETLPDPSLLIYM